MIQIYISVFSVLETPSCLQAASVQSFLLAFFLITQLTTSFRIEHFHVSALRREGSKLDMFKLFH